ncbi:MAG: futalosine hydrolase [Pirellulaceae bacterium]|nr:MAG: futalosine hydrolase [Pirellulaceae bacterium]
MPTENRNELVLVPTPRELSILAPRFAGTGITLEVCGFGPIVAAARTTQLVDRMRPSAVFLIGIAGSLRDEVMIGSAWEFDAVGCYGIGVGEGELFQPASKLGYHQWDQDCPFGDVLDLSSPRRGARAIDNRPRTSHCLDDQRLLLTACSCSDSAADALRRLRWFPGAIAEDMEGFAVAAACRLANVPLRIWRGISNRAGDRDKANWDIQGALMAVADLFLQEIAR